MSYPEHLLGESYPSAERQSVYSTAPADWANGTWWWLVSHQYNNLTTSIVEKLTIYIFIKYIIWFGFYGISAIIGYLMPNLYTYIDYIWFVNIFSQEHFWTSLSSFFFAQLNGFKSFYLLLIICLHKVKWIHMICQISFSGILGLSRPGSITGASPTDLVSCSEWSLTPLQRFS